MNLTSIASFEISTYSGSIRFAVLMAYRCLITTELHSEFSVIIRLGSNQLWLVPVDRVNLRSWSIYHVKSHTTTTALLWWGIGHLPQTLRSPSTVEETVTQKMGFPPSSLWIAHADAISANVLRSVPEVNSSFMSMKVVKVITQFLIFLLFQLFSSVQLNFFAYFLFSVQNFSSLQKLIRSWIVVIWGMLPGISFLLPMLTDVTEHFLIHAGFTQLYGIRLRVQRHRATTAFFSDSKRIAAEGFEQCIQQLFYLFYQWVIIAEKGGM